VASAERKGFGSPDEVREFDTGRAEILNIGGGEVGRYTVQPGCRWSEHVKPMAGTELCEAPHFQYHVSGTIRIRMADGTEFDVGPGEVSMLPPGHDAGLSATSRSPSSTRAARTSGRRSSGQERGRRRSVTSS
jgi:quercetin dioxygenase-like cupin family protein